jgi:hypothetical protein
MGVIIVATSGAGSPGARGGVASGAEEDALVT